MAVRAYDVALTPSSLTVIVIVLSVIPSRAEVTVSIAEVSASIETFAFADSVTDEEVGTGL